MKRSTHRRARINSSMRCALEGLERRMMLCMLDHAADVPHFQSATDVEEIEPNDTLATATTFTASESQFVGSLWNQSDIDFYRGSMSAGQIMTVDVGTDPGQRHYKPKVELLDPDGNVLMTSTDGSRISHVVSDSGDYSIRVSSASAYGSITGGYGSLGGSNRIRVTLSTFPATSEPAEPNDSGTTSMGTSAAQGMIQSPDDIDRFSFSVGSSQQLVVKFTNPAARCPSVRVYNSNNTLIASDFSGVGLTALLPSGGTYTLMFGSDNSNGTFTGGYIASAVRYTGNTPVFNEITTTGVFDAAPLLGINSSTTYAISRLESLSDLDTFAVDLLAGKFYSFGFNSDALPHGRQLTLFNEFGQFLETTSNASLGSDAATGFGWRPERTGRHYLVVRANTASSVGPYVLTKRITGSFPTLRDVPLVFHDYTGQAEHLGLGPAEPLQNAGSILAMIGLYESRYDQYDVDVTTIEPNGGSYITFGAGNFGDIGAYGYGGNYDLNSDSNTVGQRRVSGQSVLDDSGSGFTNFPAIRGAASVMNQEIGHASGTYAHARNPTAAMAYDNQSSLLSIGTYTPFPWTDSRVPDVETRNEREYYDWALGSGRFALEDSSISNQSISSYMSEMTGDSLPRNDRVVIAGRIESIFDVDDFSYTASTNKTVAFDIDSAEFQNPLDARMEIIAPNGIVIASSDDAMDRDSGMSSVDPYLTFTFSSAGTYTIRVTGKAGSFGNYRLKTIESQAFDTTGPRVIASLPNGGDQIDSTRQLTFFFNDQIDPASINSNNVVVTGATSGVRSGTMFYDPTDTTLTWYADAPLPVDWYTVTIMSGVNGLRDLRGNQLDGETDGSMMFPEVSGDGATGGNFVTNFEIWEMDQSPSTISSSAVRRHPYNRVLVSLSFTDDLDTLATANAQFTIRGAGTDGILGNADDRLLPADVLTDKVRNTIGSHVIDVYSRGPLMYGSYRIEATTRDAAGNTINISRNFTYNSSVGNGNLVNGPSVNSLSIAPGTWVAQADSITAQFSLPVDLSTLNTNTFKLRYSTDSTFHDADDIYLTDADGTISWNAQTLQATFAPSGGLASGYYLLEISGVIGSNGLALDGEFQNSRINGSTLATQWHDAPSGDGFAGGDYRASFIVADLVAPTVVESAFDFETRHAVRFELSENVQSLDESGLTIRNIVTNEVIPTASLDLQFNPQTHEATLTFPGLNNGLLSDGNWRLTLSGQTVRDTFGNQLDGNGDGVAGDSFNFDFFTLAGDVNRDRVVNFSDLLIVSQRYGTGGNTFSSGNVDYSAGGAVNFSDLLLVAQKYGSNLPAFTGNSSFASTRSRIGDDVLKESVV